MCVCGCALPGDGARLPTGSVRHYEPGLSDVWHSRHPSGQVTAAIAALAYSRVNYTPALHTGGPPDLTFFPYRAVVYRPHHVPRLERC